jgi:hypothetical protein
VNPRTSGTVGPNANAKIVLHLLTPTTKSECTRTSATPPCNAIVTQGSLYPAVYYAYVLVVDAFTSGSNWSGVAGVEFGIQYTGPGAGDGMGIDIYSWNLCATTESPMGPWPNSGSGNRLLWDLSTTCKTTEPGGPGTGVTANFGYFYLGAYTPGVASVTPAPSGAARVIDCHGLENTVSSGGTRSLSGLGSAGFGSQTGYNPCGFSVPIRPTTWSGVKTFFN